MAERHGEHRGYRGAVCRDVGPGRGRDVRLRRRIGGGAVDAVRFRRRRPSIRRRWQTRPQRSPKALIGAFNAQAMSEISEALFGLAGITNEPPWLADPRGRTRPDRAPVERERRRMFRQWADRRRGSGRDRIGGGGRRRIHGHVQQVDKPRAACRYAVQGLRGLGARPAEVRLKRAPKPRSRPPSKSRPRFLVQGSVGWPRRR